MTSNIIYIVALGGGFKCPNKIHLNTQWGWEEDWSENGNKSFQTCLMNWVKILVVVSKALISCIFDDQSCLMMLNHLIANSCISQGRAIFSLKPIKRLGSQSFSGLVGIQKYLLEIHMAKFCGLQLHNFLSKTQQKTWFIIQRFRDNLRLSLNLKNMYFYEIFIGRNRPSTNPLWHVLMDV